MKTLLQFAAVLALITVSLGAAVLTSDAHRFALHLDRVLTAAQGEWRNEAPDVRKIIVDSQNAAAQMAAFATEQRTQLTKTSVDSDKTVKATRVVIDRAGLFFKHADEKFNSTLLPHLDQEIAATTTAAQFSLEALTHSADTLTFQLNDPAISQMAEHLNAASFSIADAGANTASATKHLDGATADIQEDVHRLTRPPSFIKQVGMALLDVAAKLGSVSAGFVK